MTTPQNSGDAQAIIDTAMTAAGPFSLDEEGRFHVITAPAGGILKVLDLEAIANEAGLLPRPNRKWGAFTVFDAASFIAYVNRHGTDDTEVWADERAMRVVAVINGHGGLADEAGHHDHALTLQLRPTAAWTAWTQKDRAMVSQTEFAEHIEDRLPDITEPNGATMLELAQSFSAKRNLTFESSKALSSGEVQLEYREQVEATAGKAGRLQIPQQFTLGIAPFEGSPAYKVTARLRYRIHDGRLTLGYALDRPEDVLEAAFGDVLGVLDEGIDPVILRGYVDALRPSQAQGPRVDFGAVTSGRTR